MLYYGRAYLDNNNNYQNVVSQNWAIVGGQIIVRRSIYARDYLLLRRTLGKRHKNTAHKNARIHKPRDIHDECTSLFFSVNTLW